ncbi:hypothetical protein [Vibrio neptunius]|uniref:Uncharacterized protein n=1 Tax=Vibrio neptunius TaxID=170651 RepID=A0ABS2ZZE9_9VIBR|nr:hypothetical protein [Vibrio neptunius]MBN3492646.1 hypothetical protein [Vibrio neptunius]MBN3515143.1 hypothetical protein [Vibrio neptunius]MBN3548981.1 hypothetical protein [Vibrio neptunius]MBN3577443.1 hypothetical protein [Vibrio neptunius]MCH9871107.1 hypothetical protein [Vibrio neptunius]
MYVSVDSLPELTPEYQQAQQQAVQEAKVVCQFEVVKVPPTDYVTILLWLSLIGYLLWLGTLLDWLGMTVFTLFTFALGSYLYYAGNPDVKQTVTLTEKGMIVTELTLVPDACFAALRYSGYVGVAISIIGVVLVGPMMFVGAGAGLLMSFKMAGVVNRPRQRVLPFHSLLNYQFYIAGIQYKNNLVHWHMFPMIEMDDNDDDSEEDLYNSNVSFYFLSYAASHEEQAQIVKLLASFITIVEEE